MKIEKIHSEASALGEIIVHRLTNSHGIEVELSNIGAGITAVRTPDREGKMADIALGYGDYKEYIGDGPCFGKTPGRYANRIAAGHLLLDGKLHQLAINNGPNHLHGGPNNFSNRRWEVEAEEESLLFTYHSPDGDEHYPANLVARVRYTLSEEDELTIDYEATSDNTTVVNLTNHTYWNLSGEEAGSALDHELHLHAERWLPTDENLVPTGELQAVAGTPMDFTSAKAVGRDIEADFPALKYGKGYDNCWVVDGWERGLRCPVAELYDPKSGREVVVESDQPGVQVYTGNWLNGSALSKSGHHYADYDGVAIECQEFPDAPNKPHFPSTVLRKGESYRRTIRFRFGIRG